MFEWLLFQAQHGATTETLHISRTTYKPHSSNKRNTAAFAWTSPTPLPPLSTNAQNNKRKTTQKPHSHGRSAPPPSPSLPTNAQSRKRNSKHSHGRHQPTPIPPSPPMHRTGSETAASSAQPRPPSPLLHGSQIHMEVQTGMCEKSRSGGYVRKTNYRPPTTANNSRNNNIQQFVTIAFDNNLENRRLRKLPSRKPRSQVKASLRSASALPTAIQSRFLTVCQLQPQHFWYGVHDVGTPCDPVPGARPC